MAFEGPLPIGSSVILNGGGPVMTVVATRDSHVDCVWFSQDAKPERSTFPVAALRVPIGD